jgi:uncharacterized membrane protein (DUF2068 family)
MTPGIRLIVLYKMIKGGLEAVGAAVLAFGPALGLDQALLGAIVTLQHHSARAWAVELSRSVSGLLTPGHLRLAAIALLLDSVLTLVEGWGLRRGHWWGPWLVVVASGLLLPFEVVHLLRRPHVGRFMVLLVNALIVGYLAWRVRVERRSHSTRSA